MENDKMIVPEDRELIEEGSAKMLYPKGVVFYNPVQVQNRDLSLFMIQLHAERAVKRKHLKEQKKEFLKAGREEMVAKKSDKKEPDMKLIDQQLKDYEAKKDWEDFYKNYDGKGLRILDALAASGLRSIRYWNELSPSLIHSITINDLDPAAVDLAKENMEFNNLSDILLEEENNGKRGIAVVNNDATHLMYQSRRKPGLRNINPIKAMQKEQYDVIDLDPYGSAAPFLDGAVQAVVDGGLLAVTCTDMAALGGSHPETAYGRYGSMPISQSGYLQELAVRILLSNIAQRAAVYGRSIRPILSVGMHFYVRVFVEVYDHKAAVVNLSLDIGNVYQSVQCPSFHTIPHGQHGKNKHIIQATRAPKYPECEETGGRFKTAGPCWLSAMHNRDVLSEAIARLDKLKGGKDKNKLFGYLKQDRELHGLLTSCSEELPDAPLYYLLPNLSHAVSCSTPTVNSMKSAIMNAGYQASGYHKHAQAIKTDAPNSVVWDIMRAHCKLHPPKKNSKNMQNRGKKRRKNDKGAASEGGMIEGTENSAPMDEEVPLTIGEKILAIESSIEVDFTLTDAVKNKTKALRFPVNPEKNWGPKKAASGNRKRPPEDANN